MSRSKRTPPLFDVLRTDEHGRQRLMKGIPGSPGQPAQSASPPGTRRLGSVRRLDDEPESNASTATVEPGVAASPGKSATLVEPRTLAEPEPQPAYTNGLPLDADSVAPALLRRWVNFSLPGLLIGVALLVVGFVIVWGVAWNAGEQAGQDRWAPFRDDPTQASGDDGAADPPGLVPPTTDPLNDTAQRERDSDRDQANRSQPERPEENRAARAEATRTPVLYDANLASDPRKPGENYLRVGTLTWRDADRAAKFLSENGLPIAVIPKDGGNYAAARSANALHIIFVLRGFPGDQFSARKAERDALVNRVKRLGREWRREHSGPHNFIDCYFDKHEG